MFDVLSGLQYSDHSSFFGTIADLALFFALAIYLLVFSATKYFLDNVAQKPSSKLLNVNFTCCGILVFSAVSSVIANVMFPIGDRDLLDQSMLSWIVLAYALNKRCFLSLEIISFKSFFYP